MINRPRALEPAEIAALLAADVAARLASIDSHGFPHMTPLWFIWQDDAFYLTSYSDRPHLRRLERDPRAGICADVEQAERQDLHRPNQQVRAVGRAEMFPDQDGLWTERIDAKYVKDAAFVRRATEFRTVIRLRPDRLVAVSSV